MTTGPMRATVLLLGLVGVMRALLGWM
jgi:hypothetical protein